MYEKWKDTVARLGLRYSILKRVKTIQCGVASK